MLFPTNPFAFWPDDEVTEEVKPLTIVICPDCDHEAVVEGEEISLCGKCYEKGDHVDMIPLKVE